MTQRHHCGGPAPSQVACGPHQGTSTTTNPLPASAAAWMGCDARGWSRRLLVAHTQTCHLCLCARQAPRACSMLFCCLISCCRLLQICVALSCQRCDNKLYHQNCVEKYLKVRDARGVLAGPQIRSGGGVMTCCPSPHPPSSFFLLSRLSL